MASRIDQVPETVVASGALALSGGGMALQIATQFGSVVLMLLNIALAIGGLWLLRQRLRAGPRPRPGDAGDA